MGADLTTILYLQVLFELCEVGMSGVKEVGTSVGTSGVEGQSEKERIHHLMVVNVSPITFGHSLLIPYPKRCLPQVCMYQ